MLILIKGKNEKLLRNLIFKHEFNGNFFYLYKEFPEITRT
jgi:hypothetical protein